MSSKLKVRAIAFEFKALRIPPFLVQRELTRYTQSLVQSWLSCIQWICEDYEVERADLNCQVRVPTLLT